MILDKFLVRTIKNGFLVEVTTTKDEDKYTYTISEIYCNNLDEVCKLLLTLNSK